MDSLRVSLLIGTTLLAVPGHTQVPTAEEHARVGMAQWSCAVLESVKERSSNDLNSFFHDGLSNLSVALNDYLRENLSKEELESFPLEFRINVAQGPSNEFMLGMIWARTQDAVFSELGDGLSPELANQLFSLKNCPALAVLGK